MRRDHAIRLIRKAARNTKLPLAEFVREAYANSCHPSVTRDDVAETYRKEKGKDT